MDLTVDSNHVITVGTTGRDASGRSEAIVSALQFNRALKMSAEVVLSNLGVQAATAVKRIPNRDDFVVGCFKDLVILGFRGTTFQTLNVIDNVHTSNFFLKRYHLRYLYLGLLCLYCWKK